MPSILEIFGRVFAATLGSLAAVAVAFGIVIILIAIFHGGDPDDDPADGGA